ncbi:AraC family two component transcriptional regulator [Streptohalobacillus salinus]|uniref:AraC family two component transcriptional regulator n=1 Tax=Streptohalobacillus salinus TaxID=621096 RepID=A0A2V3WJZ9_9BACI|nr:response regulator [Streptohalobacillus salinus]PXW92998.1 AraC family two component transcriptional regulator [Streptohalobacillus salinus]
MIEKTIVIVDDEPRAREGIKRTLSTYSEGQYDLHLFDNAKEALSFIEQETVHLLITDIQMAEMDGLALVSALDAQKETPAVIVVSAYSDFNYAKEALRLQVTNYLVKPVKKNELIEATEAALEKQATLKKQAMINEIVDDELLKINDQHQHFSRSIKEAITYIDDFYDQPISLKEVAHHVHLNASYLSTLFKDELKISFVEYLTRIRIQHAKQLLLTSDLNVTEVAEAVGYHTPKYFNKVFREFEGTTPGAYRKNV